MIQFRVEWHEAPGVRDQVLARTWGRLVIEAGGRLVTEVADSRAESIRGGVFGSVFPLAEWIAENWWYLIAESYRFPRDYGSRDLARSERDRAWIQRHSLLAAREGMALPDLMIYRDGDEIVTRWDSELVGQPANPFLRFISSGHVRLHPPDVERALSELVRLVLSRLEGVGAEEAKLLRENWLAVLQSLERERPLCEAAASLGRDPYDPSELTEELTSLLATRVAKLEASLRKDLLEAASAERLDADLGWIGSAKEQVLRSQGYKLLEAPRSQGPPRAKMAFEEGYACAQALRRRVAGASIDEPIDLRGTLVEEQALNGVAAAPEPSIDAVVGADRAGQPVLVTAVRDDSLLRFSIARAAYLWTFTSHAHATRLLTEAHTWDQRASRAFAAEFLAPSSGLRRRVSGRVSLQEIDQLAAEFRVSPQVIIHQIDNHRIGWVDSL